MQDDESIIAILPISKERTEDPGDAELIFATREGHAKRSQLKEYVRINRNGKLALKFASKTDTLVAVRTKTAMNQHVVLVTAQGMAVRFHPAAVKTRVDNNTGETMSSDMMRIQGRISQGVRGIQLDGDDHVVGIVVSDDPNTSLLTITRNGMAKRSRLGSGTMDEQVDEATGDVLLGNDGQPVTERDGYRLAGRGTKGVRTMFIEEGDAIVAVRQIPNLEDQLFLLTEKGMMLRLPARQTKDTKSRTTKGTRLIELRNEDRTGFVDRVIFAARLPAHLVDPVDEEE